MAWPGWRVLASGCASLVWRWWPLLWLLELPPLFLLLLLGVGCKITWFVCLVCFVCCLVCLCSCCLFACCPVLVVLFVCSFCFVVVGCFLFVFVWFCSVLFFVCSGLFVCVLVCVFVVCLGCCFCVSFSFFLVILVPILVLCGVLLTDHEFFLSDSFPAKNFHCTLSRD